MRIEGISMYVDDIEKESKFFEKYFDGRIMEKECNREEKMELCRIAFSEGVQLELVTHRNVDEIARKLYLGYRHMAINVGSNAKVFHITKRMCEDGYEVMAEPQKTRWGYRSYVMDGEGNVIEITA
ncbi:MAG: VOC family protein [Hespellia sp.]|nr:VOC family protein [Hespellia sp.]